MPGPARVCLLCPTPWQTLGQDTKDLGEPLRSAAGVCGRDHPGPTAVWMHIEGEAVIAFKATPSPKNAAW